MLGGPSRATHTLLMRDSLISPPLQSLDFCPWRKALLARIFKNIDLMLAKSPELKGGAPFIIKGMMFLNAPMPVRSVRKAKECFQTAHQVTQTHL